MRRAAASVELFVLAFALSPQVARADDALLENSMTLELASIVNFEPEDSEPIVEPVEDKRFFDSIDFRSPARFGALWENDGVLKGLNRSDRYYSDGLKLDIAWSSKPPAADLDTVGTVRRAFGLSAAQLIFTPDNLKSKRLIEDDRPYAGWLYGAVYFQWDHRKSDRLRELDHIEVDIGVVGQSSQADETQIGVHEIFDQEDPLGWVHQLHDEIAIDFTWRHKWRLDLLEPGGKWGLQWIPEVDGTIGTVYRQVGAGMTLRFGMNMPDDYGLTRIADANAATGGWRGTGWYGMLRVGGNLVEHNIFLDGNQFRDSHSVDKRPLVGEVQFGFVFMPIENFEIGYTWTFETDEFWGQEYDHSYATLWMGFHGTF